MQRELNAAVILAEQQPLAERMVDGYRTHNHLYQQSKGIILIYVLTLTVFLVHEGKEAKFAMDHETHSNLESTRGWDQTVPLRDRSKLAPRAPVERTRNRQADQKTQLVRVFGSKHDIDARL